MNYKLISLHIACGLLLATGIAFGMEKESTNPEQQLNFVLFDGKEYYTYDHELNQIQTNPNITIIPGNCTLKYTDTEQTLDWSQKHCLTKNKLSPEQIKAINDELSLPNKKPSKVYIEKDNQLFLVSKIEQSPIKRQRSNSSLGITRTNSSANIARNNNSNTKVQQEENSQELEKILNVTLTELTTPNDIQTETGSSSERQVVEHQDSESQEQKKAVDAAKISNTKENDKKSSSRFSAYHLIAAIGGIGILAGIIASLKHPEKATQLLEAFTDRMAQLLQSARTYASSYQNNPINGIAA